MHLQPRGSAPPPFPELCCRNLQCFSDLAGFRAKKEKRGREKRKVSQGEKTREENKTLPR